MFVFVQDASKSIASSNPEPGYLVWLSERRRQRVQGSGVGEALVGPVAVLEVLEFVQGVQQMFLVPDQGSVQQFAAAGPDPAFHDRVHARCLDATEHDLDARIGEHGVEQLRELAAPVADEVPGGGSGVIEVLCGPG
jgi:hypothetical protein